MPCSYYTPEEENQIERNRAAKYKQELDEVTRLLCEVMTVTERDGAFLYTDIPFIRTLEQWWENHKQMDAQRINKEEK